MQDQYINISLLLLATLAIGGQCNQYIQQVSYGSVPGLDKYLKDSSSASAASAAVASGGNQNKYATPMQTYTPKVVVSHQSQSPHGGSQLSNGYGYTQARSFAPSYGVNANFAPAFAYIPGNPYPSSNSYSRQTGGYRGGAKYTVQGLHGAELYSGKQSYKSYHSPPHYNRVALSIVASEPVAKVYKPSSGAAPYGSPSY